MRKVAKAILESNGTFLILKGKSDPFDWENPGGKCEADETPENAILREIKEETGLTVDTSKLLDSGFLEKDGDPREWYVFLCSCKDKNVILSDEHTDFKWLTLSEIVEFKGKCRFRFDFEVYQKFLTKNPENAMVTELR